MVKRIFMLRIEPAMLKRLRKIAEQQGCSVAFLIRKAVEKFLEEYEQSKL
ncbi:MAG: ribbon-helix-helix domain-containing protein [Thermoproteota archaeon]